MIRSFFRNIFLLGRGEYCKQKDAEERESVEEDYDDFFVLARSPNNESKISLDVDGNYDIISKEFSYKIKSYNVSKISCCIFNNGNCFFMVRQPGNELKTDIFAYERGQYVGKFTVGALSGNAAISSDGNLGLLTCYRSDTEDSGKTIVFKIPSLEIVSKFSKPTEWSRDSIVKRGNDYKILFSVESLGDFLGDTFGNLDDKESYISSKWERGGYSILISMVEDEISKKNEISPDRISFFISALDRIESSALADDSTWKAEYYRARGKCEDLAGNYEEAIKLFDHALILKPKIGVKRRYDFLLKHKLSRRGE